MWWGEKYVQKWIEFAKLSRVDWASFQKLGSLNTHGPSPNWKTYQANMEDIQRSNRDESLFHIFLSSHEIQL